MLEMKALKYTVGTLGLSDVLSKDGRKLRLGSSGLRLQIIKPLHERKSNACTVKDVLTQRFVVGSPQAEYEHECC